MTEQLWLRIHQRVDYVTIDALRTFIRLYDHRVVVDEALGYLDGEVVGAQLDALAFGTEAGPWRRCERDAECGHVAAGGRVAAHGQARHGAHE